MPRIKTQVLSLRTSDEVKDLLRVAANKEHRSLSSMIEHMVYDYAQRYDIAPMAAPNTIKQKKNTQ